MRIFAVVLFVGACAVGSTQTVSTREDTKGVSLTVYNQNFAVVREKRDIRLDVGLNSVRFEDVASRIDPTSISFKSLTNPTSVTVREQNYQYDLLNPSSILNKSVGQTLRIRQPRPDGSVNVLEGVLLNPPSNGGFAMRLADGRIVLNPAGEVEITSMPEGLVARPSLLWLLDAELGGTHQTEVSYMANDITWKSDYVAVLDDDDKTLDLTGWVTLDNRSGATYANASLQLMAGDVRRVQTLAPESAVDATLGMAKEKKGFEEQSFFEYHLYTLAGATTIRDNEQKQMTLLSASGIGTTRKLVFDGTRDAKVRIVQELVNSEKNRMGMPLPKGKVRLYKRDPAGHLQFVGEDLIDHTPKDETVKLFVGNAFDVVGERKHIDRKQVTDRVVEDIFVISIRNHKDAPVRVILLERFWGDWQVLASSHTGNKTDAHTLEIPVTVPKDGAVKVRYTVRIKW